MPRLEYAPWYEKVLNAAGEAESSVGAGIMYSSMDNYRRDKIKAETSDIDNGKLKEEGKELDKKIKEVEGKRKVGELISNKDAANELGRELNGVVKELKNGYKVEVSNGNKKIIIRVMNEGSGGRKKPYFRVSIDGKGSLTLNGQLSSDRALTHIDMNNDYLNEVISIINKYLGK